MAGLAAESLNIENAMLRAALADAKADLQRHESSVAKLQGELMAARLESAGARAETVQFRGMVERAQAATRIEQEHLATLKKELGLARNELTGLRSSLSWRVTQPMRQGLWRLRLLRARLRRPPASPAHPDERNLEKQDEATVDRSETVTVERLYHLSRTP
jgi:hypothetical protein